MQTRQTITLFGTVSNPATSRTSKNGRKYTAFGVAIISDRNLEAFHYNVVAWGKQGHRGGSGKLDRGISGGSRLIWPKMA